MVHNHCSQSVLCPSVTMQNSKQPMISLGMNETRSKVLPICLRVLPIHSQVLAVFTVSDIIIRSTFATFAIHYYLQRILSFANSFCTFAINIIHVRKLIATFRFILIILYCNCSNISLQAPITTQSVLLQL